MTSQATSQVQPVGYFAGAYVDKIRDLTITSLVAGVHGIQVGAPRWGKTDVTTAIMRQVYGKDFSLVQLHEAIEPGEIRGELDITELMTNSKQVRNTDGTPYDVSNKAGILDEVFRANSTAYSLLMFLLDRKFSLPVPFVATANFLVTDKKYEALLERFAVWHWVVPNAFDAEAMAVALMGRNETDAPLQVRGRIPTAQEIEAGYNARPGAAAVKCVSGLIKLLSNEVLLKGWTLHPGRIALWSKILFRMGFWASNGNDNFATVPQEAIDALQFAWPCRTVEEYAEWTMLVNGLVDPLQAALDDVMNKAAKVVNEASEISDPGVRNGRMPELLVFHKTLTDMSKQFAGDDRPGEAVTQLSGWFMQLSMGNKVSRM